MVIKFISEKEDMCDLFFIDNFKILFESLSKIRNSFWRNMTITYQKEPSHGFLLKLKGINLKERNKALAIGEASYSSRKQSFF